MSDRSPLEEAWAPERRLAYRPAELAAMVGLSAKAIYRAIGRGELRAAKVANGSRLLIPADAADTWLAQHAVQPNGGSGPPQPLTPTSGRPLREAFSRLDRVEE